MWVVLALFPCQDGAWERGLGYVHDPMHCDLLNPHFFTSPSKFSTLIISHAGCMTCQPRAPAYLKGNILEANHVWEPKEKLEQDVQVQTQRHNQERDNLVVMLSLVTESSRPGHGLELHLHNIRLVWGGPYLQY